ncbi:MAG: ABC transporter permease [Bacillota bacterium]|jgi:ABC-type Na+ efflux pump permease subunit
MRALVLLRKDIRTVLRNRRELLWMIMLPIILLAVNIYLQGQAMEVAVGLVGDVQLITYLEQAAKQDNEQIHLTTYRLGAEEAERRLQAGVLHAYILLQPDSARMYANTANTAGAVAEALFAEFVQQLNLRLAEQKLSQMMPDPGEVLASIRWEAHDTGEQVSSAAQLVFSSLFVIMGVMTALSLGQQSISMERDKKTLVSLRKSPLSDQGIIWAKLGAALFSSLLPLTLIVLLIWLLMPAAFLADPVFYLTMLLVTFNSVSLGLLVGTYVRGANEGNGWRFVLTLPAMFLASLPVTLPVWLERLTSTVPTLISAQVVREYLIHGVDPSAFSVGYLLITGVVSLQLAASLLGREE